jgi:hypothetical protein
MRKTRTRANDNSITDQMRSANKCCRRPHSAARYLVWTARRHFSDRSITKNYRQSEIHITTINTGQMVRMSRNDNMWSTIVSNDTKPSRSEKFGFCDTFYDTTVFAFSQDSHVSHDIRTGHLRNTSQQSHVSANPLCIYALFLYDRNARVPMKTSMHTTIISRYLTDTYVSNS